MFEREILLGLKRKYTKDEELKFIFNQIEKAHFEIGELKSENEELKYKIFLLEKKEWNRKEDVRRKEEKLQKKRPWLDGMNVHELWNKYKVLSKQYEKLQNSESVSSLSGRMEMETSGEGENMGIYS